MPERTIYGPDQILAIGNGLSNPVTYINGGALTRDRVARSALFQRPKPQGMDLLFNGRGMYHQHQITTWNRWHINHGYGYFRDYVSSMYMNAGSAGDSPKADLTARLHSRVKDQKVNLAMALAEYRQTANLFADSARRVASAWRSVRRGKLPDAFRHLAGRGRSRAESNWLAFQYGVRPLVSDLYGSMELLEAASRERPPLFKVTVSQKEHVVTEERSAHHLGQMVRKNDRHWAHRWLCYYIAENQFTKTGSSLGFTNPLELAWELVPYSFVVDWFVNVGDVLSSLDTLTGVSRVVVYKGYRLQERETVQAGPALSEYFGKVTYRSNAEAFPYPRLSWSPSLSWQRIVSGVALLRQSRSL